MQPLKKLNKMDIDILINQLHNRLNEYKKSPLFNNKILKRDILAIEIALCLFEMAIYCDRNITKDEEIWFEGSFYLAQDITGEWEDITKLYGQIANLAAKKFSF